LGGDGISATLQLIRLCLRMNMKILIQFISNIKDFSKKDILSHTGFGITMCENETWMENFKGKCITCVYATPHTPKKMICNHQLGATHGLGHRGSGGGLLGVETNKLFGCIYWSSFLLQKKVNNDNDGKQKIDDKDCPF
jgi:hypothetical protein